MKSNKKSFLTNYPLQTTHYKLVRGFSLMELLIYIAIVAVIMVITTDTVISLSRGRGQSTARSEVDTAIRFAIARIQQDLKNASSVTTPAWNTSSATLQATVSGVTILYDVSLGQLRRKEGAASPIAVSGTNVFVDTPTFTRLENYNSNLNATTTAVQISMTFRYNSSSTDWLYTGKMQTTVSLR
ncbi:MAG: prepilin-type N-terminal cleavage/methylation domain-containing protein [Candidatus Pacebacteria bacterium]|nr:prepilin-type N-terminal cleavage/methylation domain-containing protein [Candidatus Paceibacterota bacterium]